MGSAEKVKAIEIVCTQEHRTLLKKSGDVLTCETCQRSFRNLNSVPILIDADNSLFTFDSVKERTGSGFSESIVAKVSTWLPSISVNTGGREYMEALKKELKERGGRRGSCLVIGAGSDTNLIKFLDENFQNVVVSDVVFGSNIDIVFDAHSIPFADDSFDCVILIAVLEHVLDPNKVVKEVSRVLTKDGLVLADTPFMQQVHMGAFDFTRFTELGHRWLFRCFSEVKRGISGGCGSATAWSLMYFLTSFAMGRKSYLILKSLSRLLFFWIKYFDYFLVKKPGVNDCASGFYFLGRNCKSEVLTPSQLVSAYHGLNR